MPLSIIRAVIWHLPHKNEHIEWVKENRILRQNHLNEFVS